MIAACFNFIFLLSIVSIIIQDFRSRLISWWTLPILLVSYFLANESYTTSVLFSSLFNIIFIAFNLIAITLYYSTKEKKLINIVDRQIGLGDVLFFIVSAFIFSSINFIIYFILSLTTAVFFALVSRSKTESIPLAGLMSMVLFLVTVLNYFTDMNLFRSNVPIYTFISS